MSDAATLEAPVGEPVRTGHPTAFYFIFFGEFAERCSYYGMRAILFLYLSQVLLFEKGTAAQISFAFKMSCYVLPLLGGFLADRFFGKYWTIVGFSVPYVLGHFVLGIENVPALFLALTLLACGSGVIKPNISTLMGLTYDQKRPGNESLRSAAFLWFYFSINVGSVISIFALPKIRDFLDDQYHDLGFAYRIAFQFPAWLMVASLAIFAAGKRHYAVEVIGPPKKKTEEERRQQRRVLARLFGVFALMVFFWSVYEQNDNLWVAFAENHVDLTLDLGFWSYKFAPDGYQFINPLLILILVPLFGWMWRKIDPEVKYFKPARKIFIGFVVTLATALLMTIAATIAGDTGKVSSWWMIVGYSVLTVAEILVYGTGLELSYAEAPANMKGFITACFLLTIGAADLVNIGLSELYKKMPEAQFYGLMTIVMLGGTIAFFFVGRRFSQDAPVLNETQNYQDLG